MTTTTMAGTAASPPTVYVVDDDPSVRKSLRRLIGSAGYAAETFDGPEALLPRGRPRGQGCVLLDLQLRSTDGLAVQGMLAEAGIDLPVVFLTGHGDVPAAVSAMKGGAVDFLTKPVDQAELLSALRRALERDATCHAAAERAADVRRRLRLLTPREREVMALVVTGMLNKQIAADLDIAEKTVKVHRGKVMEKMAVESVAELVVAAQLAGIAVGTGEGAAAAPAGATY